MRILTVTSGNHKRVAPFVTEQAEALRQAGCEVKLFTVNGHGIRGYLHNLNGLKADIKLFRPDVVHAHYGLCGLLCTLQHMVPVVVTYHGSDINDRRILMFSRITMRRAAYNIFVGKKLMQKAGAPQHSKVIPCGVDINVFRPSQRDEACRAMQLDTRRHYVLFAGAFDNDVKNPRLAKEACAPLQETTLLELKGYSRTEVAALMNAADALLMTSHCEGSPQVIKEAMAVGLPVVSVEVGDVAQMFDGNDAGIIAERTPEALFKALEPLIEHPCRTDGRRQIIAYGLDNSDIARQLITLYSSLSNTQ